MIGKTLGHYQIASQLGKGGMGEVFQAKDQVLGREVAIKVLPEEFARDADRVARFQREAKGSCIFEPPEYRGNPWAGATRPKANMQVYSVAADRNLMAVPIKLSPTFEPGLPIRLFSVPTRAGHSYAVSGDGQRFLMINPATREAEPPITVVVNWQKALKQ